MLINPRCRFLSVLIAAALLGGGTRGLATDVFTLYTTSVSGPIASGAWDFYNDGVTTSGALAADTLNGVSGGTLNFHEASFLDASVGSAVTAGDLTFNDGSTLLGNADSAINGGQQTFNNGASLQVSVGGAVKSGTQTFNDISFLTASASNSVSGGTQIFHSNTTLYASATSAVNGGTQNFDSNANLYVSASGGVSGGVQDFAGNSHLDAAEVFSITGGAQSFHNTATLYASSGNAVSGGTQNFDGTSLLNAFAGSAVSGGTQNFSGSSVLNASLSDAVSGGAQNFSNSSSIVISAAGAVSGASLTLKNESSISTSVNNGLGAGTSIVFDASAGGTGGLLRLSGHDTTVGAISSVSNGGKIENASATAATLTVNFNSVTRTYAGLVQDGVGGGALGLTKGGTGTLVLTRNETYTGNTTISGGTLQIGNGGAAGAVPGNIVNNGSLVFNSTNAPDYGGSISGSGGVLVGTSVYGAYLWSGAHTYSGSTVVNNANVYVAGSINGTSNIDLGQGVGSFGAIFATGGSVITPGDIQVGVSGDGAVQSSGGGAFQGRIAFVGKNAGSFGLVTVNDAGSTITLAGALIAGDSGSGEADVLDGGVLSSQYGYLAFSSGGDGTVIVSGSGSHWAVTLNAYIGYHDVGVLTVSDGGKVSVGAGSRPLNVGVRTDGVGTLNIGARASDPAAGAGIINASSISTGGLNGENGAGTVVFNHTGTAVAPFYLTKDGTSGGASVPIDGGIAVVQKSGTTVLSAASTYTGGTTIAGGTLLANNTTGSATGSGTVLVGLSGTLGGSGAVGGNTTVNGSLKPGNGVGSLTFGGSLSLNTGSQTVMEISGLVPTTEFDQIFVSGAFSAGGTLRIVLVNGFAPTAGASFDLFNWGSQTATFDSLDFSAAVLGSGLAWDSSTFYSNGVLSVVVAVPEPATGWGVAMGGLLALAALCRRHKTTRENPSAS